MQKTPATHKFRITLVEEMRKKGVTSSELSRAVGVSHKAVRDWVTGKAIPTYVNLALISEHLNSRAISHFGRKAMERKCEFCGKIFILKELRYGRPKVCSKFCHKKKRSSKAAPFKEVAVLNAVADFCKAECPFGTSGACRNSSCNLAPFTPLPFAEPAMQTPINLKPWPEEERKKRSEWVRKYYSIQENKERVRTKTIAGINAMSPAQKASAIREYVNSKARKRASVENPVIE